MCMTSASWTRDLGRAIRNLGLSLAQLGRYCTFNSLSTPFYVACPWPDLANSISSCSQFRSCHAGLRCPHFQTLSVNNEEVTASSRNRAYYKFSCAIICVIIRNQTKPRTVNLNGKAHGVSSLLNSPASHTLKQAKRTGQQHQWQARAGAQPSCLRLP